MSRARAAVLILLQAEKLVAYDKVWSSAMTFPLTLEKDLKDWIHEWELTGQLEIIGMKENQRVPQLGQNVSLMWKK